MENIWEEMQRRYAKNMEGDGTKKKPSEPQLKVRVSLDHLQAFFSIVFPADWTEEQYEGYVLEENTVYEFLKKNKIVHGILEDEIQMICQERIFDEEMLVAQGDPAVSGQDGLYSLHIETEISSKPKELDDGRVDYHQLDLIRNVVAGDVLCTVVMPTKGRDGCDIHGKTIKPRGGMPAPIRAGKNVAMIAGEDEETTLLAAQTDGRVEFKMGVLMVEEIYLVIGDVGPKTGHVDFKGSVKVMGNVLEGFNIIAEKDVHISGRVEGCIINAGGNVVIEDGVAGMDKAIISVKGNFTSRFLENATVICGGDVFCDISLRSFIKAKGSIHLEGQKGTLVGGECLAGVEIIAHTIGSQRNLPQNVSILPGWEKIPDFQEGFLEEETKVDLEESLQILKTLKEQLSDCVNELDSVKKLVMAGDFKSINVMKKLMDMKTQLEDQINQVRYEMRNGPAAVEALKTAAERKQRGEKKQCKITCRGKVYPGVRIFIEHEALVITEERNHCFFIKDKDCIYAGML